jgi:hypothetical protein
MRRIHFIEIEDEPWCPNSIRDAATDYLQFVIQKANPYQTVLKKLQNALEFTRRTEIVDLCSGGGGPWSNLIPALKFDEPQMKVRLTDKYPNLDSFNRLREFFPDNINFSTESVDAAQVPKNLKGFRTLFTSFHHFRPKQARQILTDAVANNEGIAIFEFTQRKISAILAMLLTPLFVLLVTPFIRPLRFSRIFWTYIIPTVPLLVGFDGVVSCLRTYTPPELQELSGGLSEKYQWEVGELPVKGSIVPVTYLIGYPDE